MTSKAMYTKSDGSKVIHFGTGAVGVSFGRCDGLKVMAIANAKSPGMPGEETYDCDEPDIFLVFKDNPSIQRLIDKLSSLRDADK